MLTCITRHNKPANESLSKPHDSDGDAIKDITLKALRVYKHCAPFTAPLAQGGGRLRSSNELDSESDRFRWSYWRTRTRRKVVETRMKGISSTEGTPESSDGRRAVVFVEENEPKEWVAQVESGVLITFVSIPGGGNDLKRIRFSQDMFNKWQAQKWWSDNYDKVMELYNVQRLNHHAFPLPTPPRSEDESSKLESAEASPVTPLTKECLHCTLYRPTGMGMGYSSSNSFDHQSMHSPHFTDSTTAMSSTPEASTVTMAKTELSSTDASIISSPSRDADRSCDLSNSNVSDLETEWVEQDEPGVYITIRALPGGKRELRRVRFSREKFGEVHATLWWEENRARIHEQYL